MALVILKCPVLFAHRHGGGRDDPAEVGHDVGHKEVGMNLVAKTVSLSEKWTETDCIVVHS